MKNALKKAISILLAAVMVFGAAPLAGFVGLELPEFNLFSTKASAATYEGTCGDNLTWSLDTSTGELIISGTGAMTDWYNYSYVPWRNYSSSIKSVAIPDSVTSISSYAFHNCSSLESVTIPDSVTSIGNSAFYNCKKLESVTIPDSVTSIGNSAFNNCTSLESVTIPDSVTSIGNSAFYNCTSLASINYLGTVSQWNDVSIGSGNSILAEKLVFKDNSDLKCLNWGTCGSSLKWKIYSNGELVISGTGAMTNYTYSNGSYVTTAPWQEYISYIKSVIISDGVTSIGSYAFYGCTSLETVTIPDSVTSIGSYAFYNCTSLESVTIPDSVTSIGSYAFRYCTSLASIKIPDSVTIIGSYAFNGCTSLASINYLGTVSQWNDVSVGSGNSILAEKLVFKDNSDLKCLYWGTCGDSLKWKLYSNGELVISGTGAMTNWSYSSDVPWRNYSSSIKSIAIPDSVTSIGSYAFYNCSSLESVTIPDSVTSIGYYAFNNCTSLETVTIPDSVKIIDGCAFYNCTSLASITIPDSVTSIGSSAFSGCTSLETVTIPDSVTSIGDYAFNNCTSIESVTIGSGVASVGSSAFHGCENIKEVYYNGDADGWNAIEFMYSDDYNYDYAYSSNPMYYAPNLYFGGELVKEIEISDSTTSIRERAFYNCKSLETVTVLGKETSFKDTTLPKKAIIYCYKDSAAHNFAVKNSYAFYLLDGSEEENIISGVVGTKLTWKIDKKERTLTIDNEGSMVSFTSENAPWKQHKNYIFNVIINYGCTNISTNAFYDCTYIRNIEIPYSVKSIGDYAFYNCDSLTSIAIPESVTSIGSYAFYYCDGLASITIPESVTSIGGCAFYSCSSLENVTINGAASIGSEAFRACSKLEKVTLGNRVKSIGHEAFYYCTSLEDITIPDSVTSIGGYAFSDCTSLENATIGNGVTSIGSDAFSGCTSLASATIGNGVTSIGSDAFYNCKSLASVTIGNSVTSIGSYAFYKCESIENITIPDSVTSIGSYAFEYCTSLKTAKVGKGVKTISGYAFAYCSNLSDIYIYSRTASITESSISIYATIHGYLYSTSETFADKYGFEFIPIVDNPCDEHTYTNSCDIYCDVCGFKREITHTFDEWVITKEATCVELGIKWHECSVCGYSEIDKVEMLTEHVYDNDCDISCNSCGDLRDINHVHEEWVVTLEPTCGAFGEKESICSVCGAKATESIAKLTEHTYTNSCDAECDVCGKTREINHSYGEWSVTKEPTCGEFGVKEHTCSICGGTETDSVAKLTEHTYTDSCDTDCNVCGITRTINHTYGNWTVTKEPTCGALGEKEHICSVCGHVETDVVAKLEYHTYDNACDKDCNVCGETRKIEHSYGKWTVTQAPTCSDYGVKERVCTVCGHTETGSVDKSDDHVYTDTCDTDCNVCGEIRKINHTYGDWVVTKEPTCDKYGTKERTCSVCGYVATAMVDKSTVHTYTNSCDTDCNICGVTRKINHSYGEWVITNAPTCDAFGEKEHSCSVCGHTETETVDKSTEHTYTDSCDTDCNICGVTRKINHTFSDWTLTKEPTCDEYGAKERVCSVCGHVETGSVEKLDEHTYTNSCDTDCDTCGEIRKINHTYGEWSVTKEPTCDYFGEKERICSVCGHTETGSVAKLEEHVFTNSCDMDCDACGVTRTINHTYGEWAVVQEPSCNVIGIKKRICSVCGNENIGAIEKVDHTFDSICDEDCNVCGEMRAASHSYSNWTVTKEPTCGVFGEKERTCLICDDVDTDIVDKLEHKYVNSCDENCDNCGEVRAIVHTYGEWVITREPTCESLGIKDRTCSVCGTVQSDYATRLEHTYENSCDTDCDLCGETREITHKFGDWKVTKEANCTETGMKEKTCSVSGCVEYEIIDILPHADKDENGICEDCGKQFEMKYDMYGSCGENLTWTIDDNGVLTISGSGAMYNFGNGDYVSINPVTKEQVADGTEGAIRVCRWNGHFDKIKKVVIGSEVESISAYAFKGCYNLENVNVPDVVISIDPSAFDGCGKAAIVCENGSYAHVYAVQNGIKYVLEDNASGAAFEIKNSMLISYNGAASNVVLPAEITSVGIDAFKGNNTVKFIEIPYSVTKIYAGAFADCSNIDSVVIPFTVTEISDSAFSGTNAKIYCYNNSYAHNYAVANGIDYELITVTLSTNSANILLGGTLEISAVPSITLASGVPFVWESSDTSVATVDENGAITAKSNGEVTIAVLTPNGETLATCSVTVMPGEYNVSWVVDGVTTKQIYKVGDVIVAPVNPTKTGYKFVGWTPAVPSEMPAHDMTFTAVFEASGAVNADILKKPTRTTISYGDSIILHVDASMIPVGGRVEWSADNGNFKYSANGESCTVSPNKSGNTTFTAIIYDAEGNAVLKDEQTMTSKAGFFDKFVAFFKKLFGLTKTIPEAVKVIY